MVFCTLSCLVEDWEQLCLPHCGCACGRANSASLILSSCSRNTLGELERSSGKAPTWSWRSSAAAQKIAIEIWSRNVESMPAPAFPNTGSSILEKIESPSCAWPASDIRSTAFIQKDQQAPQ